MNHHRRLHAAHTPRRNGVAGAPSYLDPITAIGALSIAPDLQTAGHVAAPEDAAQLAISFAEAS
jgi:hypothetical protein